MKPKFRETDPTVRLPFSFTTGASTPTRLASSSPRSSPRSCRSPTFLARRRRDSTTSSSARSRKGRRGSPTTPSGVPRSTTWSTAAPGSTRKRGLRFPRLPRSSRGCVRPRRRRRGGRRRRRRRERTRRYKISVDIFCTVLYLIYLRLRSQTSATWSLGIPSHGSAFPGSSSASSVGMGSTDSTRTVSAPTSTQSSVPVKRGTKFVVSGKP